MRLYFIWIAFLSFNASGQIIPQIKLDLYYVNSVPEAHEYLKSHEKLIGDIFTITSGIDTIGFDPELFSTNKGALIDFDTDDRKTHIFYKTLATTYVNTYRFQYIFIDDWKI